MWHSYAVTREQREKKNGHRGAVVWLTGLPASGKSTIAHTVEKNLHHLGVQTVVLDGDNIRHGLCADLRFSISDGDFIEIYCNCPLPVCRERDPKGMYAKAESGAIAEFTGISSPYEAPLDPALILDTGNESVEECVNRLTQFLLGRGIASP